MPAISLTELCSLLKNPDAFKKELFETQLDYSSRFGNSSLRNKLAEKYQTSPNNFLITSGASEAILLCFTSLFDKGDEIIVQKPIYQSLHQIAEDRGLVVHDWDSNIEKLEELIKLKPLVKALVINNPNNPTGFGFNAGDLQKISEILNDRLLIADEVFQAISNLPSAFDYHENSIVISDLSKSHSMPGLRIGWLLTKNTKLLEKFSAQKNYLSLRSSTSSEIIANYVLEAEKEIIESNKKLLEKNLDFLFSLDKEKLFFDLDIDRKNIHGLSIFPKLKSYPKNNEILYVDGKHFGKNFENHMRIGFGAKDFPVLLSYIHGKHCEQN